MAMTAPEETDRLRVLVDTGIAISSELSLDGVLERIVEAAARVTGCALRSSWRDRLEPGRGSSAS